MKIISLFYLYHFAIFIIGLVYVRCFSNADHRNPEHRFAIFIPAHNEDSVIFDSVRTIKRCNYPPEMYDIFVVADNCSDSTSLQAKKAGACVLVRENKEKRGKQHAIKWAFKEIDTEYYDAVVILDADNHVHENFLYVLDSELSKGNKVVQGYIETKNPGDSWVTANYAFMFWYICRLQMARKMLGLSAWLAGTGFCICVDTLRRVGWNVQTLTDDVEYTCELILAGEKVTFAHNAIIYDQKPRGIADSMNQRLRWIRGQTQTCIKYIPRFLAAIPRFWWQGKIGQMARSVDALMWIPMHLVIAASVGLSVYQNWWQYLLAVVITVPAFNVLPMVAEQIRQSRAWAYLVTAGAFFLTWLPITIYGVVTSGNTAWWKTPH